MLMQSNGVSMTEGSPMKHIFRFSVPLLVGNLFQQFYNMADTVIVGRGVGKDALAAVGSTGSLSFLILGCMLGVCAGFCIPISRAFGAGDYVKMRQTIANAVLLGSGISVILTVGTLIFTRRILVLMNTPLNIYRDSYDYIIIMFLGIPALMFYNLLAGILRAIGDSKTPLYFLIISVIMNVAADILLVIGMGLGVAGAALATVASQFTSGILCLIFMFRKFRFVFPKRGEWRFSGDLSRKLFYMGIPMGLQYSIIAIGSLTLQSAVNSINSDAVAAMTLGSKIQNIVTVPMEALGLTLATYCSQNLGARKYDRIRKGVFQTFLIQGVYDLLAWAVIFTAGKNLAYLFIDKAEAAALIGNIGIFLRSNSSAYISLGILFVCRNFLQGTGNAVPAMAAGFCELAGRAVTAVILVRRMGFPGAALANPIAWILADFLLVPFFVKTIRTIDKR